MCKIKARRLVERVVLLFRRSWINTIVISIYLIEIEIRWVRVFDSHSRRAGLTRSSPQNVRLLEVVCPATVFHKWPKTLTCRVIAINSSFAVSMNQTCQRYLTYFFHLKGFERILHHEWGFPQLASRIFEPDGYRPWISSITKGDRNLTRRKGDLRWRILASIHSSVTATRTITCDGWNPFIHGRGGSLRGYVSSAR